MNSYLSFGEGDPAQTGFELSLQLLQTQSFLPVHTDVQINATTHNNQRQHAFIILLLGYVSTSYQHTPSQTADGGRTLTYIEQWHKNHQKDRKQIFVSPVGAVGACDLVVQVQER